MAPSTAINQEALWDVAWRSIRRDEPGCLILTPQIWITLSRSHKKRVPMHQPVFHGMRVSITAHIFGFEAWWTHLCLGRVADSTRRTLDEEDHCRPLGGSTAPVAPLHSDPLESDLMKRGYDCFICDVCMFLICLKTRITSEGDLSHHLEKYNLHDCILWDWRTDKHRHSILNATYSHIHPTDKYEKNTWMFSGFVICPFWEILKHLKHQGPKMMIFSSVRFFPVMFFF